MSDFIISFPIVDDVWDEDPESGTYNPIPQPSVEMIRDATNVAYLTPNNIGWPVSKTIVGEWDEKTGEPLSAITSDYETWIRPLGNIAGDATGILDSPRWQGHSEAKNFEYSVDNTDPENPIITSERYPSTNRPFILQIERTYITNDGWPQIPHGWKVTMESSDALRDITARAIGIYNESDGYLYTTGAFLLDGGTDKYFTECPIGQRTASEVPIYFKLLLGASPEGAWNIQIGTSSDQRLFWTSDQ